MHRFRLPQLLVIVLLVAVFSLLSLACSNKQETPAPGAGTQETGSGQSVTTTESAVTNQSDKQDDLVAKAKEEGGVTVLTGAHTLEQIELVAKEFEKTYGIPVTFSRQNSGAVAQQMEAQLSAGAVEVDVVASNDAPTMVKWASDGVIVDPELPNRDQIMDVFNDGKAYVPFAWLPMGLMYNTTAVQKSDLAATWKDFPASIGKHVVVHADPRASGVALSFVWAVDKITEGAFYKELVGKRVMTSESGTAVGTIILSGEADYATPGPEVLMAPLLAEGEPVGIKFMDDGIPAVENLIGLVAKAPHPNAARLFMRFHLSEEFQQVQADKAGTRSVLKDGPVPPGLPKLDESKILLVDSTDLKQRRDELVKTFEQILK